LATIPAQRHILYQAGAYYAHGKVRKCEGRKVRNVSNKCIYVNTELDEMCEKIAQQYGSFSKFISSKVIEAGELEMSREELIRELDKRLEGAPVEKIMAILMLMVA